MTKAFLNILTGLALCLGVAGCATSVKTNVSTVHKLPGEPNGEQIAVYPADGKPRTAAEFETYSTMLSYYLVKTGFTIVPISQQPKLVASLDYGVESGKQAVTALPVKFGASQSGVAKASEKANNTTSDTAKNTTSNQATNTASNTRGADTKYVELTIAKYQAGQFVPVFQSRLIAQGVCGDLNKAMPDLLGKLFKDFPRESGSNLTITEPLPGSC